jgi:glycosyltransferase involved in cell wall biosynthesis
MNRSLATPQLESTPATGRDQSSGSAAPTRTRPIRVCFLIDRLATAGTETQLLALIRHLDRSRVEPVLCLLDGDDEISRALEPADCRTIRLGVKKLVSTRTPGKVRRFREFLRAERIDVLQPYFADSTYYGVLAGRLAGVPYLVRTRNNANHWMRPIDRRLGRLMNRFVTVTLCNSQAAREAVLADERPDPATVLVIENGVDLDRFDPIAPYRPGPAGAPRRVGMVANLRHIKGVDLFLRAAAFVAREQTGVTFQVAGEGPERPEFERLIADLGLGDRFTLLGSVADVPGFLASLDLAVLSSRAEGMSNAVLEYMAAGRPIVATAVGDNARLIEDRVHGLIVPAGDEQALTRSMLELLEQPCLAAELARHARSRCRERFSRQAMVRRFEEFYGRLVAGQIAWSFHARADSRDERA